MLVQSGHVDVAAIGLIGAHRPDVAQPRHTARDLGAVLLRRFRFEMTQPSETYRDDYSKMVIQLQQPCRVAVIPREG